MKNKAAICQNQTVRGTQIYVAQIRKLKTNKIKEKPGACCAKKLDQKEDLVILHKLFNEAYGICFWTACQGS